MEKDRLGAFIDAVLAIIMTILVLELPRPETTDNEYSRKAPDFKALYIFPTFRNSRFFTKGNLKVSYKVSYKIGHIFLDNPMNSFMVFV